MTEIGKVGLKVTLDTAPFEEAVKRVTLAIAELGAATENLNCVKMTLNIDDVTEDGSD